MDQSGKKILIVEDDPMLRGVLDEALKREGYTLANAADGEAGLKAAHADKPDLIILDVILPKKTGIEVMQELRKDMELKDVQVLLLTNETDADMIAQAMSTGSYAYLIKSESNMETIVGKVKELIG